MIRQLCEDLSPCTHLVGRPGPTASAIRDTWSLIVAGYPLTKDRAARAVADWFGGDPDALLAYVRKVRTRFTAYVWQRRDYCRREGRCSVGPFWRYRHDRPDAG
jgi:hypothetical protein